MKAKSVLCILGSLTIMTSIALAQGPGTGPGGGGMGPGSGPGHGGGSGEGYQSYQGWQDHDLEHNLVLPQIAVGGNTVTTLALFNMGNHQQMTWLDSEELVTTGTLYFFRQTGDPLTVQIDGVTRSDFQFSLNASEMAFIEIEAEGPLTPGWMLIKVDSDDEGDDSSFGNWGMMDGHSIGRGERVMATAYYTIRNSGGKIDSQTAVMPAVFERGRFLNSVVTTQVGKGINTGIALVNTSKNTASVKLVLRNANGTEFATHTTELKAGNQTARFIDELFSEINFSGGFRGMLAIETVDEGIISMGLLMSDGVLTSLPTHHYGTWSN
jgi:hypothetical protein